MPILGSAHHSRCVVHPRARATDATPFEGASEDEVESADLLPRDRCSCQRPRPFYTGVPRWARHRSDKGQPRTTAERKSTCPKAWDLQPHGPSLPKAKDDA